MVASPPHIAAGKPAEYEDFLLSRRYRLSRPHLPPAGGHLLDIGCGNGAQTFFFTDAFIEITAVDINEDFLNQFATEAACRKLEGRCHTIHYSGERLPLRDAQFQCVTSFEVLEHVHDESLFLTEIHRVLAPDGILIMSVPNRWWVFETHGANLPLLPWNRVPFFSWLPTALHDRWARARIYTRRKIVDLLHASGFTVYTAFYVTAPMDVLPWRKPQQWLRHTIFRSDRTRIPFLATSIMVVAKK